MQHICAHWKSNYISGAWTRSTPDTWHHKTSQDHKSGSQNPVVQTKIVGIDVVIIYPQKYVCFQNVWLVPKSDRRTLPDAPNCRRPWESKKHHFAKWIARIYRMHSITLSGWWIRYCESSPNTIIWLVVSTPLKNNPFPLLLNVPQIPKTRVHLQFWKISDWPIWL